MDTRQKHENFLKSLDELLTMHEVDLALLPDDERGFANLCVVSDGRFTELCRIDALSDDYVYLSLPK